MDREEVAVATISLARYESEERLLRGSLRRLAQWGMPVWVADGGSPPDLVRALAAIRGVTVLPAAAAGLVAQVERCLHAAAANGRPFVLYTEPDKAWFFGESLGIFIDSAPVEPSVGIVVAARSPSSYATFPSWQRRSESMINELTGEALGIRADYSYGPFLLRRDLAMLVGRVAPAAGWGWRHFLFAVAHRLGYAVRVVEGEYRCPEDQRQEDDGDRFHRLRQLAQNVEGLVDGLTIEL